jgi:hypothetical protein
MAGRRARPTNIARTTTASRARPWLAYAGCLRRELAGGDRRGVAGGTLLSRTADRWRDHRPAREILTARRLALDAPDAPDVAGVCHAEHPHRHGLFRARRHRHRPIGGCGRARRGNRHHPARPAHLQGDRAPRLALFLGRSAGGRHPHPRIPADHVPRQDLHRGRGLGVDRLGQFRRTVLPAQRRGQSQHLRPRFRASAHRHLRGRPRPVATDHLAEWENRPWRQKIMDWVASHLRTQL